MKAIETLYWVLLLGGKKNESDMRFYNTTNAVLLIITLVIYTYLFIVKI